MKALTIRISHEAAAPLMSLLTQHAATLDGEVLDRTASGDPKGAQEARTEQRLIAQTAAEIDRQARRHVFGW